MLCIDLRETMASLYDCEETEFGTRVLTHCLYPSFSQVSVFVVRVGDGFRVHDGGEARREAWLHGRDDSIINPCLKRESLRHHLEIVDGSFVAKPANLDWLPSAILAVANASAAAATAAVARFNTALEGSLVERIHDALSLVYLKDRIVREYTLRGKSGKDHSFDFALLDHGESQIIIDAISPHHNSIAAKYVAFADTDAPNLHKFAVYERPLLRDDVSLMQQVASIVPFGSLIDGSRRILNVRH
jgi:hypothetical protein